MSDVLLPSIVLANMLIAIWAARDPSRRRGIQKAILLMLVLNFLYGEALKYVSWFL